VYVDSGREVWEEVGAGALEERATGTGNGPGVMQGVGFFLCEHVAESVVKLFGDQRDSAVRIGGIIATTRE
jgi:hypothetical protein